MKIIAKQHLENENWIFVRQLSDPLCASSANSIVDNMEVMPFCCVDHLLFA